MLHLLAMIDLLIETDLLENFDCVIFVMKFIEVAIDMKEIRGMKVSSYVKSWMVPVLFALLLFNNFFFQQLQASNSERNKMTCRLLHDKSNEIRDEALKSVGLQTLESMKCLSLLL